MVTLTARCPFCKETIRTPIEIGQAVDCPLCERRLTDECPDLEPTGTKRCITCPSTELFVRKDFPQRLGVAIVFAGFIASSVAWYYHQVIVTFAILFATALIDVLLYIFMGNVLECYRCHAQYRGLPSLEGHEGFELEVHEKYRQQAARLKEQADTVEATLDASRPSASS